MKGSTNPGEETAIRQALAQPGGTVDLERGKAHRSRDPAKTVVQAAVRQALRGPQVHKANASVLFLFVLP